MGKKGYAKVVSHRHPETCEYESASTDRENPQAGPDEKDLVTAAARKEAWAMEILVEKYQERAFSISYQMLDCDREKAMDAVQEAFLKVFRGLSRFKGDSSFYTWFFRILVNTVSDMRRKQNRMNRIFQTPKETEDTQGKHLDFFENTPDETLYSNPHALVSGKDLTEKVNAAIRQLPEKQRLTLELRINEEMRISDIAMVTKMAEGTVKTHLFRAMRTLREIMSQWKEMEGENLL